jgi:FMN phosphatase YigB (HAD superfamily)
MVENLNPVVCDVAGLATLLDRHPGIKVLTVDCFDTLVWRKVAKPSDVFDDRDERRRLESLARARSLLRGEGGEPHLIDFYPDRASREIEVERAVCFPFVPVVQLMQQARARGIRVAVVSDTYHEPEILRELARLDETFRGYILTSSQYRMSKAGGLFRNVGNLFDVQYRDCLHIGDNLAADFEAPRKLGMRAELFRPIPPEIEARERRGQAAAILLDPSIRNPRNPERVRISFASFRRTHAQHGPTSSTAELIGRTTLGPLLAAFYQFQVGRSWGDLFPEGSVDLFMMRDASMLRKACDILDRRFRGSAETERHDFEISRFAATAASFRDREAVEQYLAERIAKSGQTCTLKLLEVVGRQLLLSTETTEGLIRESWRGAAGDESRLRMVDFSRAVMREGLAEVLRNSADYRIRFARYFSRFERKPGQSYRFIDLGYSGTTIKALRRALPHGDAGQAVYLLGLPEAKGATCLLDPYVDDPRMLRMLARAIGPVELMCSRAGGSVIDYTDEGDPIFEPDLLAEQRPELEKVQTAALEFLEECDLPDSPHEAALQALGGLLVLPGAQEVEWLASMRLDANGGSSKTVPVCAPTAALQGLRYRGGFYFEKPVGLVSGAEERAAGGTGFYWAAMGRYELELAREDLAIRVERVELMFESVKGERIGELEVGGLKLEGDGRTDLTSVDALATFDGFFSAVFTAPHYRSICCITFTKARAVQIAQICSMVGELETVAPGAEQLPSGQIRIPLAPDQTIRIVFRPVGR